MDAKGKLARVFHGTTEAFDELKPGKSGIYFSSNPKSASQYSTRGKLDKSSNVRPAYLDLKRPLVVDAKGGFWDEIELSGDVRNAMGRDFASTDEIAKMAKESGKHDGVIFRNKTTAG